MAGVVLVALAAAVSAIAAVGAQAPDYLEPRVLSCSMFPVGGGPLLFKSERRAIQTNGAIYASCDFVYPNGELAAQDRIVYRAGQLVSFEEDQLQLGEKGSAVIQPDPKHPGAHRIFFQYTTGQGSGDVGNHTGNDVHKPPTIWLRRVRSGNAFSGY